MPIISRYSQKIAKGSTVRHWDSVIVISHSEKEFLPVSMNDCKAIPPPSSHPQIHIYTHTAQIGL